MRTNEEKSWTERIRDARLNGGFSGKDALDVRSFQTCLVGEAIRRSGHAEFNENGVLLIPADSELLRLGASTRPAESVIQMVDRNEYDKVEAHLLKVQARIDELYGEPPFVALADACGVEEGELVLA